MNERIKQLAEQAYDTIQFAYAPPRKVFNHLKFAELIVRECADFIDSKLERGDEIYDCADGEDLRQHFGIDQ